MTNVPENTEVWSPPSVVDIQTAISSLLTNVLSPEDLARLEEELGDGAEVIDFDPEGKPRFRTRAKRPVNFVGRKVSSGYSATASTLGSAKHKSKQRAKRASEKASQMWSAIADKLRAFMERHPFLKEIIQVGVMIGAISVIAMAIYFLGLIAMLAALTLMFGA